MKEQRPLDLDSAIRLHECNARVFNELNSSLQEQDELNLVAWLKEYKELKEKSKDVPPAYYSKASYQNTDNGITVTERGWAGHYILARDCLFRRNTLIQYKDKSYIVSTIGGKYKRTEKTLDMDTIGHNRYYETEVFRADKNNPYYDAYSPNSIAGFYKAITANSYNELFEKYPHPDLSANDMHEETVREVMEYIQQE